MSRALIHVLLFIIGCVVLLVSTGAIQSALLVGALTSLGTLFLTALFVRWDRIRLTDVGAAIGPRSPLRFVVGFMIGLGLVALHMAIEASAGPFRWARSTGGGFSSVMLSLATYFLLSCREELAFHGYPLRRLNSFLGLWLSQIIVALLFAMEHVVGGSTWVEAIFGAGVGSLLFGMAAIATKGLALPIGLHAAWNFGDWIRGGKDSSGIWYPIIAENFRGRAEVVGTLGYVVVMLSATAAFWFFHRRSRA